MKNSIILLSIIIIMFAGCIGQTPPVTDYESLKENLRAEGLTVEPTGKISQPFLSANGTIISVNNNDIQIFEFKSPDMANSEARLISPDGSKIGTSIITWVATPHFYKKDKLIVLYVGDDDTVIKGLEKVLGKQFAGR